MSYTRQPFGQSGEDRISGIITRAHVHGAIAGAVGGLGVASLLGLGWGASILLLMVGALFGVVLVIRIQGLTLLERVGLRLGYQLRRWRGSTAVPPTSHTTSDARPDVHVVYGGTVIARAIDDRQSAR